MHSGRRSTRSISARSTVNYAVSFNGKARYNITVARRHGSEGCEAAALGHENAARWIDGKQVVKVIVVPVR